MPADLALVRAAVLTDAEVQALPGGEADVPDGAAALLRWGDWESVACRAAQRRATAVALTSRGRRPQRSGSPRPPHPAREQARAPAEGA